MISVLYVDDERFLLDITKMYLENSGDLTVDVADSAGVALERLSENSFDTIISDYQMPGMNGIEFLKALRDSGDHTPFIIFTGRGREEVVIEAINSGAAFYIQKGGEPKAQFAELDHKVRQAVNLHRDRIALQESESRLRALIENLSDFICILDGDGKFVFVSPASEQMLGYPPEAALGRDPLDFVHSDDRKKVRQALSRVYANMNPHNPTEFRIRRADGTCTWVEAVGKNLLGVQGVDGVVITIRFIEERKQAEAVKRQSEEKFRMLLEHIPDLVMVHREGKVVYTNQRMTRSLGYRSEEIIGTPITDYITPKHEGQDDSSVREKITAGVVEPYEIGILSKSGESRTAIVRGIPIEFDNVPAVLNVFTDITERKRAEEALRQANRQLGILTSITRHDILNKVKVLLRYFPRAEERLNDPVMKDYLDTMKSAVQDIRDQIESTRIYQDLGAREPRWQALDDLISRQHFPLAISLSIDLEKVFVFADLMFEKVFFNLLDNSIRHGRHVTAIRVSTSESDAGLTITWQDNGAGIPSEEKPHIFQRGYGKNTGLGLFLCREILSITGIGIAETGNPGEGARFEILVPKGAYRIDGE